MLDFKTKDWFAFLSVVGLSAFLCAYFYNDSMYGPDDGYYAYIAEQINNGALYGRDILGFHPGAIHYLNAFVFKIFGSSFLTLRFPLIAITLIQTGLAYLMFRKQGMIPASLAALSAACFSFILFPNPSANWYCAFLTIAALYLIKNFNLKSQVIVFAIGFTIGLSFMFRHLSGIFIASGLMMVLVSYLAHHAREENKANSNADIWTFRLVIALLISPLAIYIAFLARSPNAFSLITIGIWPLLYAILVCITPKLPDWKRLLKLISVALMGCIIAALPFVLYQIYNDNLFGWLSALIDQSLSIPRTSVENPPQYGWLIKYPIRLLENNANMHGYINLIFFAIIPLLSAMNGIMLITNTLLKKAPNPFLIIGAFYGYIALYLEIPTYLFYTLTFTLLGIISFIWTLEGAKSTLYKYATTAIIIFLCTVAPYYHAGQSVKRTFAEFVGGQNSRSEFVQSTNPKIALNIDRETEDFYNQSIEFIQNNSDSNATIFAYPFNPELYFLSGRQNVINDVSTLPVNSQEELENLISKIQSDRPDLIIHSTGDKYNNEFTKTLSAQISDDYSLVKKLDYQLAKLEFYKKQN